MVLYTHEKPNGEIFYVGIGTEKRPYTFTEKGWGARSSSWWNIVHKHGNPIVKIIKNNLSLEEALKEEKNLIKSVGRKDLNEGTLINHTDGGDGVSNWGNEKQRNIRRKRMSVAAKKRWNAMSDIDKKIYFEKGLGTIIEKRKSEINSRAIKTFWVNVSEEKKKERMEKLHSHESMSTEKRSKRAKEFRHKYSPEKNAEIARKREMNMTEEQKILRSQKIKKHLQNLSLEEKKERKKKAWITRRNKKTSKQLREYATNGQEQSYH
jgi:hypothetical protein